MSLIVSLEDLFNEEGQFAKPSHWERIHLRDIVKVLNGFPLKSTAFTKEKGFPVIRIRDLKFNQTQTFYSKEFPEEFIVGNGDLLVGMDGDFICYEWGGGKAVLNQRVCKLIPNKKFILKRFLFYGINSYLNAIQKVTSSVTVKHLSSLDILKIPFPLAPLSEQEEIVTKLDALVEKIQSNKIRLENIYKILKRFRQSVLSAAVSGKLVKTKSEWRNVELNSLVDKGGIFDGPFGSNLKTSDYTDRGVRVIRLGNIDHLHFISEKESFISNEKYKTLTKHTVAEGDIIFSSFITDEIRVCKLPKLSTKAIAKADCFCVRPNEKRVNKDFLLLALASHNSYNQLVLNIHGATRPRINTTQFKKLIVALPPLTEQKEIVRRVEQLFSLADKIEERFNNVNAQIDKLPQALLAKAFRGELMKSSEKIAMGSNN